MIKTKETDSSLLQIVISLDHQSPSLCKSQYHNRMPFSSCPYTVIQTEIQCHQQLLLHNDPNKIIYISPSMLKINTQQMMKSKIQIKGTINDKDLLEVLIKHRKKNNCCNTVYFANKRLEPRFCYMANYYKSS